MNAGISAAGVTVRSVVLGLVLSLAPLYAMADEIVLNGHARVVDVDTLAFDKQKVRSEGTDAPESGQKCEDARS